MCMASRASESDNTAIHNVVANSAEPPWFAQPVASALTAMEVDPVTGLSSTAAEQRLRVNGANELPSAPETSVWQIIGQAWAEPMNALLTVLIAVSVYAEQQATAVLIGFMVLLNIAMATNQQIKARSSAAALADMHSPTARVRRDARTQDVPAASLVTGDIIVVEAGDLIPADARIIQSAGLEVSESALTGESTTVAKDNEVVADPQAALGDRTSMLYQNTAVTRGSAQAVVVATGADTQMGQIASMLAAVTPGPSPLQRELRQLTIRLAIVCLVAVAFIVGIGLARGLSGQTIALVAIATAISSTPSGLPTFLTAMLSYGAQRLAKANAIVRNLNDVETLGSVSAINTDKTGTLTMDMMTATAMYSDGQWFEVEGEGYKLDGRILTAAGKTLPDFTALGYGLTLCSDAEVAADGSVLGDPTELALVVLAAKMGVAAATSRREYPRVALVPFDSEYKFMATYHVAPLTDDGPEELLMLLKGAPDVVLQRCSSVLWQGEVVPIAQVREKIETANEELAARGLRVMSFAYRAMPTEALSQVQDNPMGAVDDAVFVALVGIIDPLRPTAKQAVTEALHAGIDVRMITGDHSVTAKAIANELGLGPGVITGPEFDKLNDAEVIARLPQLHVFGRVSPQNKLRLVSVMQEHGQLVAMTGDAVNDAAALKKADIGVAMGSGSEVSKQSANMILTDNNFATLVHAIELGRDIYNKITAQIRYVMVGLFGVLVLMLTASAFNFNSGNALTAVQLIFVTFLIGLFPALAISTDTPEPDAMNQPPRDPNLAILNGATLPRWILFGVVQAAAGLAGFWWADSQGYDTATAQTMTFAVMGCATVFAATALRRDLLPAWSGPYVPYLLWLLVPLLLTWFAVESESLQPVLSTVSLTSEMWGLVVLLALVPAIVIEVSKAIRRLSVK